MHCSTRTNTTFAENSTQVKSGISEGLLYSGGVVPLRSNWVNRQALFGSPISRVQVRGSSVAEEAGTRDGDTHLLRGGFIIEPQGASLCRGTALLAQRATPPPRASRPAKSRLTSPTQTATMSHARCAWGRSSAGRALPSQGRGRGFESPRLHQWNLWPGCLGSRAFFMRLPASLGAAAHLVCGPPTPHGARRASFKIFSALTGITLLLP